VLCRGQNEREKERKSAIVKEAGDMSRSENTRRHLRGCWYDEIIDILQP